MAAVRMDIAFRTAGPGKRPRQRQDGFRASGSAYGVALVTSRERAGLGSPAGPAACPAFRGYPATPDNRPPRPQREFLPKGFP